MPTHADRAIHLKTPLADDVLLPRQVTGTERFSEPYRYELQLLSEQGNINPDEILGKTVCVSYDLPSGGGTRYFHGFVTEFGQVGYRNRLHEYQATVRPWFWLLTRTSDCRIFQQRTVPEIFQEVCKAWGFTDYKLKLGGSYPKRDYCVQYRETDFNFLSRLLEEEGIYYFFEHGASNHIMVLADDSSAHDTQAGYESVPFYPPGTPEQRRERDHLSVWSFTKSVQPGAYATTDFDFKQPRASLLSTETIGRKHPHSSYEIFDYPAELAVMQSSESKRIAKLRIQELQSPHMVLRGQGNAAGLATGKRFKLTQYPREDLNIEYLMTGVGVSFSSDPFDTGVVDTEDEFTCSIEAVDARTPFRPARETRKPIVHGAQTAMVVGPKGEEIYTDEHARVKVQFHWDRHGKVDENSSCWIRVAQVWAGKGWGALHIPRIGQEVIVSFLEGDPDQPIVTGRVYNGESKSPYDLPANKTQSGIKSRSSKDGGAANFNEIRFEDQKGSEQLFVHAEKNYDIEVENDETHWVGNDRARTVDRDESVLVKRDRTMKIDRDKTETVVRDKSITVTGRHHETIARTMEINVGSSLSENVAVNYSEVVGAAMELTVGAALAISVGGVMTEAVGGAKAQTVGGSFNESTGGSKTVSVGSALSESVDKSMTLKVGQDLKETITGQHIENVTKEYLLQAKKIQLKAEDELTIKVGSAEITVKKNGDITMNGAKLTFKASGALTLKGSKIAEN